MKPERLEAILVVPVLATTVPCAGGSGRRSSSVPFVPATARDATKGRRRRAGFPAGPRGEARGRTIVERAVRARDCEGRDEGPAQARGVPGGHEERSERGRCQPV